MSKPAVVIYTTPTCPFCKMAKDFLRQNNVSYTEINVAEDQNAAMEMIKKSGQMGVPVLDIDGEIIVGFDREAIKRALNLP
ncbi:MAG: Uxx-star family glutaredoxin-like (seleno)protein [Candidatus Hadarchaeales archaeon]